ncbi:Mitochondrial import inner membrane translocase subunit tim23 [Trapelia coarctata]|nr:Mitochondrial import inner membrane translocase subunit tim23 [Trapelia coarctata]
MTLWDTFTGRRPSPSSSHPPAEPSTTFDTPTTYTLTQPTAQSATDLLNSTSIPDPSALHPLAGLNAETLDYLTLEDTPLAPPTHAALPSRGWSDDLCYGTGITYISALSLGGAWGLIEGLNRTPASAPPKLRLNSVLNSVTRRGPFLGNSAGVLALVYNLVNSAVGAARGKSDAANSVVAGAVSGMLFKSTRGVRPMMISGGLVAGAAGAWAITRKALF